MRPLFASLCLLVSVGAASAADAPAYRTDAEGFINAPSPKKWYALTDGAFPPEGSAHAVSGELIHIDHLERRFYLRVDRNDSQDRGVWDLCIDGFMLPYGSIFYRGAPAALQDIPQGTHLHGLFYLKPANDKDMPPPAAFNRRSPEGDFRRCFQLEDDFSHHQRLKQKWKIDEVNLEKMVLTATLQQDGAPVGKPKIFDLLNGTTVYKGNEILGLKALQPGQNVLVNLTWVTLYGPGRITDLWIDDASREQATARQLERHRLYIRERGFPGWINSVDDVNETVTMTFFAGFDTKLFDEMFTPAPIVPGKEPLPGALPKGGLAVARDSLMTYDPVNDRKGAGIMEFKQIPLEYGSSGYQLKVKCDMMLEGYRPKRVVRFFPPSWKVKELPREEKFEGRE